MCDRRSCVSFIERLRQAKNAETHDSFDRYCILFSLTVPMFAGELSSYCYIVPLRFTDITFCKLVFAKECYLPATLTLDVYSTLHTSANREGSTLAPAVV